MTRSGKLIGIVGTSALFALCTWVYLRSGDWVALVFAVGCLAWAAFFLSRGTDR